MNNDNNVILAALKLARAMRRCPPDPAEHPFPPAVGRLLACIAENRRVSSRDLCELLDVRPSSLSEMLARAEEKGWITRTVDEEDRRIQRVDLSAKGESLILQMEEARKRDLDRKTSCFTEEEKAQFCALSNKLSDHLESMAVGLPPRPPRPPRGPHGPFSRPGFPGGSGFPAEPDLPEPVDPDGSEPPEASGSRDDSRLLEIMKQGRLRC